MNKITLLIILFAMQSIVANAQDLTIKNNADEAYLLDRFEIMSGTLQHSFHLTTKSVSAKNMVSFLETIEKPTLWTKRDEANRLTLLQKHHEYTTDEEGNEPSNRNLLHTIYKMPTNFFEYGSNGVFVAINPIIYYNQMLESGSDKNIFLNTRGFELKGYLNRKVSFYTQLTDNQERGPSFVRNWITNNDVVPGAAYIKAFKGDGTDYTLAKGYIDVEAMKDHIHLSFGNDKFFIGDGYRSLFLGDFGNNHLFLKMNTKFWRIHYQNIFTELYPTRRWSADNLLPRKYAAMHHLSINIKPWLNVGAFEAVVFGRKDHFDFQYLNPVIFYRTIEQQNGSPDNALLGFDTKILPIKNVQVYSQFLLDEFSFEHIKANKQWWANKYAWQIGAKYINVANIAHLDVQLERNYIRPFTYSYRDSVADYSNYNQSLAHPNGANLIEHIAIIRYQPIAKCFISLEIINRRQGMYTSATFSNGGNILKNYNLRNGLYDGFNTLGGTLVTTNYANFNASFQVKNNVYVDAGYLYRKANSSIAAFQNKSSNFYIGFRMNTNRRMYNY